MRHVKKFDHLNENLKPGYSNEDLAALMIPVINQVKAASFTKEAQESGDITNEQVLGLIVSKLTGWDYEKISATAGYAYEDSNYHDEAEKMFKEAGIRESHSTGLNESAKEAKIHNDLVHAFEALRDLDDAARDKIIKDVAKRLKSFTGGYGKQYAEFVKKLASHL